jgi:HPr kinase/phosphorylase
LKTKPPAPGSARVILSGGFLQIFGLGVIIVGDSGIGKSESGLELVSRGHRFISDDVVDVARPAAGRLVGKAPALSRYFMEIRGLGIINIREIFGARSICRQSQVDLVIRLKKWHRGDEYDRLGLEFPEDFEILGVKVPQLILPVAPGRTIALLIEVACKVHLLRKQGYHASREIVKKLDRALS